MLHSVLTKTLWDRRRVLLAWAIGIVAVGTFYAAFFPAINTPDVGRDHGDDGAGDDGGPRVHGHRHARGLPGVDDLRPARSDPGDHHLRGRAGDPGRGRGRGGGSARPAARASRSRDADRRRALPGARGRRHAVCLVLFVALVAISGVAQLGDIGATNLLAAAIHLAALGVFFGGLALAVGAATGSRAISSARSPSSASCPTSGTRSPRRSTGMGWARDLSPFRFYSGGRPLVNGLQAADLAVLVAVTVLVVALGTALFNRRDVAV